MWPAERATAEAALRDPIWAVIPLKEPEFAKSRLAATLPQAARRRLFFLMAQQVIRAARESLSGVLVVTPSAEVAGFAQRLGAHVIIDDTQSGTAEACRAGAAHLAAQGIARAMILPGDLPLAHPADLAAAAQASGNEPGVALVPDRRGEGTNLLLLAPPLVIDPAFGPGSAAAHEAAARRAGVRFVLLKHPALQLDIDDVPDLEMLRALIRAKDPAAQQIDAELAAFIMERDLPLSDG